MSNKGCQDRTERVNMTMSGSLRSRFEAWRSDQYNQTGRIPTMADAARILVHKGLVAFEKEK